MDNVVWVSNWGEKHDLFSLTKMSESVNSEPSLKAHRRQFTLCKLKVEKYYVFEYVLLLCTCTLQ